MREDLLLKGPEIHPRREERDCGERTMGRLTISTSAKHQPKRLSL
jgi:hypothetical protein